MKNKLPQEKTKQTVIPKRNYIHFPIPSFNAKYTLLYITLLFLVIFLAGLLFTSFGPMIAGFSGNNSSLIGIFLTGLLTGGLTCMAVQGGLLAATLAQSEEERLKEKAKGGNAFPILAFLGAKLTAYTLLGFLLGWFGSIFQLSLAFRTTLDFAIVIFMIGTALNILNIHPIFRYFVIQPPRFLTRLVRKQSKSTHFANASRVEKDMFAPGILGAFTIFIPCGTTQAMMALAIASGKPWYGAAILFAFVLGTSPIFFILGYFATKLGDAMHQKFMRYAAYAIIILALFNLNNAIELTGSSWTPGGALYNFYCFFALCNSTPGNAQTVGTATQNANVVITAQGYNPDNLTVKTGSPVTIHLTNTGGQGCTQAFTIPSLGIQKIVPMGSSDTVAFTAPNQAGDVPFMCSMGMYRGVIHVI